MHFIDNSGKPIQYTPARLVEGKEWYVTCSAPLPDCGTLKTKRFKVNHIKNIKQRRRYGRELAEQLNARLRAGWNPWTEQVVAKGGATFLDAMAHFLQRKSTELRPDSMRSYKSNANRLLAWMELVGKKEIVVPAFDAYMARDFMEQVLDQGVSAVRYNNVLTFGRLLFAWMVEREYCSINPFLKIKKLPEEDKIRQPIPVHWQKKLFEYLESNDPSFLLPCMLLFYGQIRPSEQIRLRVRDVQLERKIIEVTVKASKIRRSRYPTISERLYPFLEGLSLEDLSENDYLITEGWKPGGKKLKNIKSMTHKWDDIRDHLGMPREYQFYSLRESGIIHMLENHVPIHTVMKQAGHTSLATTSKYLKYLSKQAVEHILKLKKGF